MLPWVGGRLPRHADQLIPGAGRKRGEVALLVRIRQIGGREPALEGNALSQLNLVGLMLGNLLISCGSTSYHSDYSRSGTPRHPMAALRDIHRLTADPESNSGFLMSPGSGHSHESARNLPLGTGEKVTFPESRLGTPASSRRVLAQSSTYRKNLPMVYIFEGECAEIARMKFSGAFAAAQEAYVVEWGEKLAAKVAPLERRADALPQRLRTFIREGRVAFVTGAGLSISCGLPSWRDLVDYVFQQIFARNGLFEDEIEHTLASVRFSDDLLCLAQALTVVASDADVASVVASRLYSRPPQRSSLLQSVGDVIECAFRSGRQLSFPSIVLTFNYDTLLERELGERMLPVESIDRRVDLADLKPDRIYVVHAHGILNEKDPGSSGIVFTEQSYGDAYLRGPVQDPLSALLEADLLPIFLGFSFRDHYVRQILHQFSIKRNMPVAVGILANCDLVSEREISTSPSAMREFSPNDRVGWDKTGKNPLEQRRRTLTRIPQHLARWMLYSVGVEWWAVADRAGLPLALANLVFTNT